MRDQYMIKLKREIANIQDKFNSNREYEYEPFDGADSYEYFVILSNGMSFYIAPKTYMLPRFNDEDIVYVRKKISDDEFEDTEIGFARMDSMLFYDNLIRRLFNVLCDFDTGCYDE